MLFFYLSIIVFSKQVVQNAYSDLLPEEEIRNFKKKSLINLQLFCEMILDLQAPHTFLNVFATWHNVLTLILISTCVDVLSMILLKTFTDPEAKVLSLEQK